MIDKKIKASDVEELKRIHYQELSETALKVSDLLDKISGLEVERTKLAARMDELRAIMATLMAVEGKAEDVQEQ